MDREFDLWWISSCGPRWPVRPAAVDFVGQIVIGKGGCHRIARDPVVPRCVKLSFAFRWPRLSRVSSPNRVIIRRLVTYIHVMRIVNSRGRIEHNGSPLFPRFRTGIIQRYDSVTFISFSLILPKECWNVLTLRERRCFMIIRILKVSEIDFTYKMNFKYFIYVARDLSLSLSLKI